MLRNCVLGIFILALCLSASAKDIAEIYGTRIFISDSVDEKILALVHMQDKQKFQSDLVFEQFRNAVVAEQIKRLGIEADREKLVGRQLQFANAVDSTKLSGFRDSITSQIAVTKLYAQRFNNRKASEAEKAPFVEEMKKSLNYPDLSIQNIDVIISQIQSTPDMGQTMLASVPTDPDIARKQLFSTLEYDEKAKSFRDLITSSTIVTDDELVKVKQVFLDSPELKGYTTLPDLLKAKALEKKKEAVFNKYLLSVVDKDAQAIDKPTYDAIRKQWQTELIDKWAVFKFE